MNKLFGANWKSTIGGILTVLVTFLSSISAALTPMAVIQPGSSLTRYAIISIILTSLTASLKVWISIITKDADSVMAKVPGQAEPQVVAAHPQPDNPNAQVVTKQ